MRPYRKERIATAVRNIVSEAIAHKMHDPRVEPLTTVTRVDVAADLQCAKVYLSVPGDEATERKTMAAIQSATGYLTSMVASELQVRQCPILRFMIDEGAKHARKTLRLLEENRRKNPELFESERPGHGNHDEPTDHSAQADASHGVEHPSGDAPADTSDGTDP